MPSLNNIKQITQQMQNVKINVSRPPRKRRSNKTPFGEDTVIRFYLHKRIRRVNERNGQVCIKISLYTDTTPNQTRSSAFSAKNLRLKKAKDASRERIDKLVAVSATASIGEVTEIALEKFHIVPHGAHYRLALATHSGEGKSKRMRVISVPLVHSECATEKLLSPSSKLIEILHDDTGDAGEKLFVLRKMSNGSSSGRVDSPRSYTSKVAPEGSSSNNNKSVSGSDNGSRGCRIPVSVLNMDSRTQDILQRVDAALHALGRQEQHKDKATVTMAVSRNSDGGVDIMMPSGVLSSRPLSKNQTQYSLLAHVETGKLKLVAQKVLEKEGSSSKPVSQLVKVTEGDLVALASYGRSYLDSHHKIPRKMPPKVNSSVSQTGAPSLVLTSDSSNEQISSLDDLEKEFQRIIAAHAF